MSFRSSDSPYPSRTMDSEFLPPTMDATADSITHYERHLHNLKRHFNTFPPINALPPEILSNIFLFLVFTSPFIHNPFDPPASVKQAYWWLRCTRVCHYWREVALQFPTLWSFIVLDAEYPSFEALHTFVSHSAQVPTHIQTRAKGGCRCSLGSGTIFA